MLSTIESEACRKSKNRLVPEELVLAICTPSISTVLRLELIPRTITSRTMPVSLMMFKPGNRCKKAPTLSSVAVPNASPAATFFKLAAWRWRVVARALPSRSPSTTSASIL